MRDVTPPKLGIDDFKPGRKPSLTVNPEPASAVIDRHLREYEAEVIADLQKMGSPGAGEAGETPVEAAGEGNAEASPAAAVPSPKLDTAALSLRLVTAFQKLRTVEACDKFRVANSGAILMLDTDSRADFEDDAAAHERALREAT